MEKSNVFEKPRCLTVGNKRILWSQLLEAYNFDQNSRSSHIHEKLTEQHFHLDPADKMRNHLAEDVLDKRMLYLMQVNLKELTPFVCHSLPSLASIKEQSTNQFHCSLLISCCWETIC